MRQKYLFFVIVFLFLGAFPGNTQNKSGEKTVAQQPPSLFALLDAAGGGNALWRPDWPLSLPPDLFVTSVPALSIIAELGDGTRLEYSKDANGRVRSFPLLQRVTNSSGEAVPASSTVPVAAAAKAAAPAPAAAAPAETVAFLQGRCEYDKQGKLLKLIWKGADADESDAEALQWDGNNRPLLWRVWSGDYYFAVLEYAGDALIETWYDRDGNALFIIITENGRQTTMSGSPDGRVETAFYYNSWGRVSAIETPDGKSLSGLYNERGMPAYLKTADSENSETLSFSWDGTGKLVRLYGEKQDIRYEYTLDSRGSWTTRKEYSMKALGQEEASRLVSFENKSIRRTIRYE
jgi:YD repeat-containing protein